MVRTIHTNIEKATCLGHTNLRAKDIMILMDCGSKRAVDMAKELREWFSREYGYELYGKQVPTEEFVKYFRYPEKRVLRYAELERKNADALTQQSAK